MPAGAKSDIHVAGYPDPVREVPSLDAKSLIGSVAADERRMVESLCSMLRVRAVGPESGGAGEAERGRFLTGLARELGLGSIEVLESDDPRVPGGKRPNIIIRAKGTTGKMLWVITHMDTVPEGDPAAWKHPAFDGTVADGRIYGRGSEDNGQELIASLFGLHALVKNGITPEMDVGLVFVSDEENGNVHGIDLLLGRGIFKKGDLVVVPDHGLPDGAAIEVVEKSIAWVNVEVVGSQTHGATPHKGVNAFEVGARFTIAAMDRLRAKYTAVDKLFDPPTSTFTPTRVEGNGPNINTVPGNQRFSFDFRMLPEYRLDDMMADLKTIASEFERSSGAKIHLTYAQKSESGPRTGLDSDIVTRLGVAIEYVKKVKPYPVGIGGGTCANPFRRAGMEAAVWSTTRETAHDANEFAEISDLVSDAQVYALLFAGKNVTQG